jgi:glycogen debranching enzyme
LAKPAAIASLLLAGCIAAARPAHSLQPLPRFPIYPNQLAIVHPVEALKPFTVAGERGALFGEQGGKFEAWLYPVKILSAFGITAELADYPVPIDVGAQAASIEVAPAMTTITYSHAAFTIKQRMFATRVGGGPPVAVLFEIDSARPLRLTFRFTPEMVRMWPAPNFGKPNVEWVEDGGYYVLHTDAPAFSAAVAMPRAQPGVLPPYQERPKSYPVEFNLAFDPKTDAGLTFPLLMTLVDPHQPAAQALSALNAALPEAYRRTEDYYMHFFDTRLTAETPDATFNRALRWAEIAIDQGMVKVGDEPGLIAGYYGSGDSARPGYAWFFGRDALWTSYALNSTGDFASTRQVLEFLIRRQREDGKIMHEFSQTAGLVDWRATPYFYAAADSTPLFLMAMEDYTVVGGDSGLLRRHWDAVKGAWEFLQAHDSDGDGIYENTEGTGWVESWPPGMPHQEFYLAALHQQAAAAMSRMASLMNDAKLTSAAQQNAEETQAKLESEYYAADQAFYGFSRNPDGSLDTTATIFPSVAWWSGRLALEHADAMLGRWASAEFSTDWGTRDISDRTSFFDPISYHQGTVWPLFTGWVSLAEYRAGRPLAGYQHLMQNAGLTWTQDLGAVTELLSGEFFQPLGRSSSHQIWSSAMVLTPALRGLFGLEPDALHRTLRLSPHLPAAWDRAALRNVPLGNSRMDVELERQGNRLLVRARSAVAETVCLVSQTALREQDCVEPAATLHELTLPLPAVEVGVPSTLPLPGARTSQLKVVGERLDSDRYELAIEGPGGSHEELPVRLNRAGVRTAGAELAGSTLKLQFPAGTGYRRLDVVFTW